MSSLRRSSRICALGTTPVYTSDVIDKVIEDAEKTDIHHSKWVHKHKFIKELQLSECIYVALIVIQNAYMNSTDSKVITRKDSTNRIACIKVGYTESSAQTVYSRFKQEMRTYDAISIIPLVVMKGSDPSKHEKNIMEKLTPYKMSIACSASAKPPFIQPREFFASDCKVVDIVCQYGSDNGFKIIKNWIGHSDPFDVVPDFDDGPAIQVLDDSITDSLTVDQRRIIRESW